MLTATIIVVAVLTAVIFSLAILAFSAMLKAEKQDIDAGKKDDEIKNATKSKKEHKTLSILCNIFSWGVTCLLAAAAIASFAYRVSGEQFSINNNIVLVAASDSMDGFYNDEYKLSLISCKQDAIDQQFQVGDLLIFSAVDESDELVINDIYGYRNKRGYIIMHRLIGITDDGKLIFRGDNTGGRDNYVKRQQVEYHYTEKHIARIGLFVLFSKSGFGLYSIVSVVGLFIITDIYLIKYDKLIQTRKRFIFDISCSDEQIINEDIKVQEEVRNEPLNEILEQQADIKEEIQDEKN